MRRFLVYSSVVVVLMGSWRTPGVSGPAQDIPLSVSEETKFLKAWVLNDGSFIVYSSTDSALLRLSREGRVLARVSVGDPSLGPYSMTAVTDGFVEGEALWVSDVHPKLVQWDFWLKPMRALTIPRVYYVGSMRKRGDTLWVAGKMPQGFYLTPGWHLFQLSWPDLQLKSFHLGTPPEYIRWRERIRVGGIEMMALGPRYSVFIIFHTFPYLIVHEVSGGKTELIPLRSWQAAWTDPRGREAPRVYALGVEYLEPGHVAVQVYDGRSRPERHFLECVSLDGGRETVRPLPGRWLGYVDRERWIFQIWEGGRTRLRLQAFDPWGRR